MTSKRDLYLGIDGVILTKGVLPALHLNRFLEYVLNLYTVSWLSSRCRGNSQETMRYLSQFLFGDTISLINRIQPTTYRLDKTEAIDFSRDFFWIEPELFDSEKNMLKKHNKLTSWIKLDLIESPNQLMNLTNSRLLCAPTQFANTSS